MELRFHFYEERTEVTHPGHSPCEHTHLAWVGEGQGRRPQLHVDCLDISGYTGTFSDMCTTEGLWERTLIVMFSLKTYFF